jgi:putative glutamine amidotransferase
MSNHIIGITGDIEDGRFSAKMAYIHAIEKAGACPVFLPPVSSKNLIKDTAKAIDALLISGGKDINPAFYGEKTTGRLSLVSDARFNFEKALLEEIITLKKPVLGICYGLQFLNVFLGGSLYQDLKLEGFDRVDHKSGHKIKIYKKSKLYYILGIDSIEVNSAHHQGIKEMGKGLVAGASSGDNLIESIELSDYPYFLGVQWHPERLSDSHSGNIFKSLTKSV